MMIKLVKVKRKNLLCMFQLTGNTGHYFLSYLSESILEREEDDIYYLSVIALVTQRTLKISRKARFVAFHRTPPAMLWGSVTREEGFQILEKDQGTLSIDPTPGSSLI